MKGNLVMLRSPRISEVPPEVEDILEVIFEALQDRVSHAHALTTLILTSLAPLGYCCSLVRRKRGGENC